MGLISRSAFFFSLPVSGQRGRESTGVGLLDGVGVAGGSTGGDNWMCMAIGAPNASTYAEAPEKLTDGTNPT